MADTKTNQEISALREENARLRRRLADMETACVQTDRESGVFLSGPLVLFKLKADSHWTFTYTSPNLLELTGYDPNELVQKGTTFQDMIHPADQPAVTTRISALLSGTQRSGTLPAFRLETKDRSIIWVQCHITILRDEADRPVWIVGYLLDISAQQNMQQELRRSRARLEMAQRLARTGSWSWYEDTGHIFWSDEVYRIYERDRSLGPPSYDEYFTLQHPLDRDRVRQTIRQTMREGGEYEIEHRIVLASGAIKHVLGIARVEHDERGRARGLFGTVQDITERKQAEEQQHAFTERIALASEAGGMGIWEWDLQSSELNWNNRMYTLYDIAPTEFSGLYDAWRQRVHPDDIAFTESSLWEALSEDKEWHHEFRIVLRDGSIRHIQAAARLHRERHGNSRRMVGINRDVTRSREAEHELRRLATTDALTGLLNRARFMQLAEREFERHKRYHTPLTMIMFDADHFKAVNDEHGHDVGDTVLRAIGEITRKQLREVDVLGRIGGEEFAVALPETTRTKGTLVAERIRTAIADTDVQTPGGRTVRFTISLGVAEAGREATRLSDLLRTADKALYKAKNNGRNRVEEFD
ncbi:PAS domain S-box-containing protein/diguanylate cyclase (GGDEF) domain-containing protein [Paucidesulfovibrio gracilis DSM 16080]|uniref:PAS domain S-box-containing protein/diguanylate cyclase (GGDEF) domain-containing protein n=1 Tax=Paucidesulfovibrio gracilis DSM 16080 TaxID=1121449 RepID=A0A1T4XYL9_9BACT|nr:sensor domain-containing diguanylate cyclase [Paucidesulfovibrio gracilis]SKA94629.1 PAS domain S-box-containing protein/diguanylate cyclase (GGDEF) domain-containing protein [Paucidesulfovibrio gracilis DSM 16080]